MFILNKNFFKNKFEFKSTYLYQDGRVAEVLINKNGYLELKKSQIKNKSDLELNYSTNLNLKKFHVMYMQEELSELIDVIEDYVDVEISSDLVIELDYLLKKQEITNEEVCYFAKNNVCVLQDNLNIKTEFVKTSKDFEDFFEPKIMYFFDKESQKVKMGSASPVPIIRSIEYGINGAEFIMGFELEIFGISWTEEDVFIENDKIKIDGLFDSVEELIENKIISLKNEMDYFEKLKKDPKSIAGKIVKW